MSPDIDKWPMGNKNFAHSLSALLYREAFQDVQRTPTLTFELQYLDKVNSVCSSVNWIDDANLHRHNVVSIK